MNPKSRIAKNYRSAMDVVVKRPEFTVPKVQIKLVAKR